MALKPWYLCLLCSIFLIVQIIQISTVQNKLTYEVALVCNATWCSYWIHIFIYMLFFCSANHLKKTGIIIYQLESCFFYIFVLVMRFMAHHWNDVSRNPIIIDYYWWWNMITLSSGWPRCIWAILCLLSKWIPIWP